MDAVGAVFVYAAFGMTGCSAYLDDTPSRPADDGGSLPEPGDPQCNDVNRGAEVVLQRYCTRCHGGGADAIPKLPNVLDTEDVVDRGLIVRGDPDASLLMQRVQAGSMPPSTVGIRPNDQDVTALREWIACGAENLEERPPAPPVERSFIPVDDVLLAIERDLRSFPRAADRTQFRYIILVPEWNRGATDEQLTQLRESISFTINSLSQGFAIAQPWAVDERELIYRIDLENYQWSAADWERAVEDYPYAVSYDQDSLEYPADEDARRFAAEATGTEVPYVHADWFVEEVSQADTYYDLLDLPGTMQELRTDLGLGEEPDPDNERLDRAGFAESGVSVSNRVIERTPLPDGRVVWSSYDFISSAGRQNIFAFPTDFEENGGEVIFALPNGLQAYYIADAAGTRLDRAPQAIVSDLRMPDRAVVAGLSCMGCHDAQGIIPRVDEVRDHVLASTVGGDERDEVLRTYIEADEMTPLMERDGARFLAARTSAGLAPDSREPVVDVALNYQEDIEIQTLASVLFVDPEQLRNALNADPAAFSRTISGLADDGFLTSRDELEAELPAVVCALNLGRPVCTDATLDSPCGCRRVLSVNRE